MSKQESQVRIDLHPIACVSAGNIFLSQKEVGAPGAPQEGAVEGRREGVELPAAEVAAGEVLEVTAAGEALEVALVVVLVVVVAVVAVAVAEDSEEDVVVSEAHNRKYLCTQHLACNTLATTDCNKEKRHFIRSYGLMALTSSSASLSLPIRSRWVFTVYNVAHGRVRVRHEINRAYLG